MDCVHFGVASPSKQFTSFDVIIVRHQAKFHRKKKHNNITIFVQVYLKHERDERANKLNKKEKQSNKMTTFQT